VEERTFVCAACGQERAANPRLKPGIQKYCSEWACSLAGRSVRQNERMTGDPVYRQAQKKADRCWRQQHPEYYREYREAHPEVVRRNRQLQRFRDARRRKRGHLLPDTAVAVSPDRETGPARNPDPISSSEEIPPGNYVMKRVDGRSSLYFLVQISVLAILSSGRRSDALRGSTACKDDLVSTAPDAGRESTTAGSRAQAPP
jgi:hypothetical protein